MLKRLCWLEILFDRGYNSTHMTEELIEIINAIRIKKNKTPISHLGPEDSLRKDLGFDSFDLAELTVRIQDIYNVDIFEHQIVDKISDFLPMLVQIKK